jgi:hypothetical protein
LTERDRGLVEFKLQRKQQKDRRQGGFFFFPFTIGGVAQVVRATVS